MSETSTNETDEYLNMSDEEFLNAPIPKTEVDEESTEQNQDMPEEPAKETEPKSDSDGSQDSEDNKEKLTDEDNSSNIQNKEPTQEDSKSTEEVNYKEFYEKVMAPFTANGKQISVKDASEAIQLMQKGANYTQKMQRIGPYRKAMLMLEKNGLLDENQLSFLIDVKNKNPEAIKKFLIDNNLDPLDIDTTQEPKYKAGTNIISDQEVNFKTALDDLQTKENGLETLKLINDTWDNESKNFLGSYPESLEYIRAQVLDGSYQKITDEVNRRRAIGSIPANVPFIQSYIAVGNELKQQMLAQPPQQQMAPRGTRTNVLSNGNKIRQAGISSHSSHNKVKAPMPNPLAMSDEEFEKQFGTVY